MFKIESEHTVQHSGPLNDSQSADHDDAASRIHSNVTRTLCIHKCVAFAFVCEADDTCCSWSPSVGTAVQLLLIAKTLQHVVDGQMVWDRRAEWTSPEAIRAAEAAVVECLRLVKPIDVPYLLLLHVHGQPTIQIHFNYDAKESIQALAEALATEVAFIPSV